LGCNYISTALERGQEFAIKKYVGGPGYSDTCQYTQQYYEDVKREYEKLKYIYKGIRFDYEKDGFSIPDISYYLKSRIPIIRK
jgi:N-methylhydantoinase B/oxoprolinase/acetone carboxylase alpha subunit